MLTKKERRRGLNLMRQEVNQQLFNFRSQKKAKLSEISAETHIPEFIIDAAEHTSFGLHFGTLFALASFYNKRIKVEIVDLPKEEA